VSFKLRLTEKPGYLHAVVTGQNTLENVMMYMKELREARIKGGFMRVLVENNLTGRRLETWDVYQIASEGSKSGVGNFAVIAFVDVNAHGELRKPSPTTGAFRSASSRLSQTPRPGSARRSADGRLCDRRGIPHPRRTARETALGEYDEAAH